jgi:hypothetical protein
LFDVVSLPVVDPIVDSNRDLLLNAVLFFPVKEVLSLTKQFKAIFKFQ